MNHCVLDAMRRCVGCPVEHGRADCFSVLCVAFAIDRPAGLDGPRDEWRQFDSREDALQVLRDWLGQVASLVPDDPPDDADADADGPPPRIAPGDIALVETGEGAEDLELAFCDGGGLWRKRAGRGWCPLRGRKILEVWRCHRQ